MKPTKMFGILPGHKKIERHHFRQVLVLVVAIPLGLSLVIAGLFLFQIQKHLFSTQIIERSNALISKAHTLEKDIIAAQNSVRGYILNQREEYLTPYYEFKDTMGSDFDGLIRLIENDLPQKRRLQKIRKDVEAWYKGAGVGIQKRKASKFVYTAPVDIRTRRYGKYFTERVEDQISDFITTEEKLRANRVEALQTTTKRTIVLGTGLAIFLGLMLALYTRHRIISLGETYDKSVNDLETKAFEILEREKELKQAVHTRDEFLSIASHELKTPLTSLVLQLQITKRMVIPSENKAPSPERLQSALRTCLNQCSRLTSLIEELLDVSRIQLGKLHFTYERVDLNDLVRENVERFHEQFKAANCAVELHMDENLIIQCDRFRIDQVLVNLLSNVLKYAPGKPVRIKARKHGETVAISVQDFGTGIPEDKQHLVFKKFERAGDANISGLGLGLYIAKQIVIAHSGTISVKSEPSQGSTFIVTLPVYQAETTMNVPVTPVPASLPRPPEAQV